MDITALSDFSLVAAHGGFGRASRATGRSKATLSRRVAELEARLGVRLVERGAHGLHLTEQGAALHARTQAPLAEIAAAAGEVGRADGRLSGRLRISAAVLFAHAHLGRIAADFALAHPDVEVEIIADDRMIDPVEDGFDIVIRANPRRDEKLVGRCFLRTERVAVAAPGVPIPENGETARAVIRAGEDGDAVWHLRHGGGARVLRPVPALRLSSLVMVRDAVLRGAGVAVLPRTMVEADLAAKRLVAWGAQDGVETELWALHVSRRFVGAKVRAFLRYLDKAFPDNAPADELASANASCGGPASGIF